jgi:hypothetical protein
VWAQITIVWWDVETIVLVTDNLNTHSSTYFYMRFSPEQG